MLKILDLRNEVENYLDALPRPSITAELPIDAVREIISQVKTHGDEALRRLTEQFDRVKISSFRVSEAELAAAYARIPETLRRALEVAANQVRSFYESEVRSASPFSEGGISVEERIIAVDRAGCYVPGGRARYPSSVIMTAVIAKVAGVREVILCVPPDSDGKVDDATLAAAHIAGVTSVFSVGGAQAIAAMAYGTESIPKVDVIVGPGNIYVSVAKREVASAVGVPSAFAGPSEVVVVADKSVPAANAAIDIAVQAEHGPDGLAWLITWDEDYAHDVIRHLDKYVSSAPRGVEILSTLKEGGYAVIVRDIRQALEVSNYIAPEHLELLYMGARDDLDLVRAAGAVFVGGNSSAAYGDYVAGPSHVLPTFGSARFSSALGVGDFQRRVHFIEVGDTALEERGWVVEEIATIEGLPAHAESIRIRRS